MSWGLWKEMVWLQIILREKFSFCLLALEVSLIVDGCDVQRSVSFSTFPTGGDSLLIPYVPKPSSVYFYFANIIFCDIHLCVCLYHFLG